MMNFNKSTASLLNLGYTSLALALTGCAAFYLLINLNQLLQATLTCLYSANKVLIIKAAAAIMSDNFGALYEPLAFRCGLVLKGMGLILKYSLKTED